MYQMISGMLVMGYFVAALFFLNYRQTTRDRLFGWFAAAFALLGCQRFALIAFNLHAQSSFEENHPGLYILRLLAFVLILIGILDKNRNR